MSQRKIERETYIHTHRQTDKERERERKKGGVAFFYYKSNLDFEMPILGDKRVFDNLSRPFVVLCQRN